MLTNSHFHSSLLGDTGNFSKMSVMGTRIKFILVLFAVVTSVGCDQVSKHFAKSILQHSVPLSFFADVLRFHYAENPGIAFSIGSGLPAATRTGLFVVGTSISLTLLMIYIFRSRHESTSHLLALSLILGGGMGNLLDRIFRDGRVIDFLNLGVGDFRTAIFNVADAAITCGIVLLLFSTFRPSRKESISHELNP